MGKRTSAAFQQALCGELQISMRGRFSARRQISTNSALSPEVVTRIGPATCSKVRRAKCNHSLASTKKDGRPAREHRVTPEIDEQYEAPIPSQMMGWLVETLLLRRSSWPRISESVE
jgi:hypothetical protein